MGDYESLRCLLRRTLNLTALGDPQVVNESHTLMVKGQ